MKICKPVIRIAVYLILSVLILGILSVRVSADEPLTRDPNWPAHWNHTNYNEDGDEPPDGAVPPGPE